MSQFTKPLDIRKVEGTKYWTLRSELVYHVGSVASDEIIRVPVGFKTDLGSKPRFTWWLVGHPLDEGARAYVLHDELMRHPANGVLPVYDPCFTCTEKPKPKPRSRRRCDQIFLEALKVLGVGWWKRGAMYCGVRVGSWVRWRKYRKREKEARRIAEKCKDYRNQGE